MEDLKEATNSFLSELKKEHKYILAIENKKIIGLVTWILHGLPKHGLFELDRICILSGSRGKGVGNRLVEAMIDDADSYYKNLGEKIRKLYLLTHEENKLAHKFYEKVGFGGRRGAEGDDRQLEARGWSRLLARHARECAGTPQCLQDDITMLTSLIRSLLRCTLSVHLSTFILNHAFISLYSILVSKMRS